MVHSFQGIQPKLGLRVFIAPSADVIGHVTLGDDSSVFFQCVLRGDINSIAIGARSNIQDQTTIHVASDMSVTVGEDVNVGHNCILHACAIGSRVLVGMGSIVMDGSIVGEDCIIGAGSLLPKNKIYPAGSLILGNPARILRPLTPEEIQGIKKLATKYISVKDKYLIHSHETG